MKQFFLYALLALSFGSCKKENALDCFKSNGAIVSESRYPGEFSKLEMNDKIEVTIYKGSDYKVEIFAGEHIIKNISAKVKNGILEIENLNKCNVVRGYKKKISAKVTVPYLAHVLNNSVANLTFDENFNQDTLRVNAESSGDTYINGTFTVLKAESNGNGDLYLKGKTQSLHVFTNGTNYVRASELLVSDLIFIQTLSMGDCFFNTQNVGMFHYEISNNGNIYYKGTPQLIYGSAAEKAKGRAIQEN